MNREEARELLPWYAVGALDGEETRAVQAHLDDSPELAVELDQYRALRTAVAEVPESEPAFRAELLDDALARIDALETERSPRVDSVTTAPTQSRPGWLQRVIADFMSLASGPRLALAVQFSLLLILGGVLLWPSEQTDMTDPGFTTLSGEQTAPAVTGPRISVIFTAEASQGEISALLQSLDAQIVAGPSAQQAYVIVVPGDQELSADQALERLRASTGLVRLATTLEAGQ